MTAIRNQAGLHFNRKQRPVLSPVPVRVEDGFTRRRALRDGFHLRLLRFQVEGSARRPQQLLSRVT